MQPAGLAGKNHFGAQAPGGAGLAQQPRGGAFAHGSIGAHDGDDRAGDLVNFSGPEMQVAAGFGFADVGEGYAVRLREGYQVGAFAQVVVQAVDDGQTTLDRDNRYLWAGECEACMEVLYDDEEFITDLIDRKKKADPRPPALKRVEWVLLECTKAYWADFINAWPGPLI